VRAISNWLLGDGITFLKASVMLSLSVAVALQALLCLGPCVQAMRSAGIHQYADFAAVTSAHVWYPGSTQRVPASIADVHALQGLSALEKRSLWLFMQQAEQAATGKNVLLKESDCFVAALESFGLPGRIQVCRPLWSYRQVACVSPACLQEWVNIVHSVHTPDNAGALCAGRFAVCRVELPAAHDSMQ
jgi:hypothetical protein